MRTAWVCDICDSTNDTREEAEECESSHDTWASRFHIAVQVADGDFARSVLLMLGREVDVTATPGLVPAGERYVLVYAEWDDGSIRFGLNRAA